MLKKLLLVVSLITVCLSLSAPRASAKQLICPLTMTVSCAQCANNCRSYGCGSPLDCQYAYSNGCYTNVFGESICDDWYYCTCSGVN